jgi:Ca2+-binding EF-hand superfamily protein
VLPPHEAKKRLAVLLLKMDLNGDQVVAKGELVAWILTSLRKQEESYAASKLRDVDTDGDAKVMWSEYLTRIYGYTVDEMEAFENDTRPEMKTFMAMVNDDKEKFRLADRDKNGMLTALEYVAFLYPHSYPYMHGHEIQRVLNDLDKNNDSSISFHEYIGKSKPGPEQLLVDRENFESYDLNKDGKLDRAEIQAWVLPDQRVIAEDEALHLIAETDRDRDSVLSQQEILDRHDLWVGSAATDYGDGLLYHDEL